MGRSAEKSSHITRAEGDQRSHQQSNARQEALAISMAPISVAYGPLAAEPKRWSSPVPTSEIGRRLLARHQGLVDPAKGVKPRTMPAKAQIPLTPVTDQARGQVHQLLHHRADALALCCMAYRGIRTDETGEPNAAQDVGWPWLGGVISEHRDRRLIMDLVRRIHACAASLAIRVCVDGLVSYVTAFMRVFRHAVHTGRRGRPRLVVEPGLLIGQVIKRYAKRRVVGVVHRVVRGTAQAIAEGLSKTRTRTVINTAYIERLNATFRSALATLVRRGRAIAHLQSTLTAGMYLVGCAYNFCWCHRSLRLRAGEGASRQWLERFRFGCTEALVFRTALRLLPERRLFRICDVKML